VLQCVVVPDSLLSTDLIASLERFDFPKLQLLGKSLGMVLFQGKLFFQLQDNNQRPQEFEAK